MSTEKFTTATLTGQTGLHPDFKWVVEKAIVFIPAILCIALGTPPLLALIVLGLLINGENALAMLTTGQLWPKG